MSWLSDAVDHWVKQLRDHTLDVLKPAFGLLGFKDRTLTVYSMSATRIIPDADIPRQSLLQSTLIKAMREGKDVGDTLRYLILCGPKYTVGNYTRYGEDSYTFGLPECTIKAPAINLPELIDVYEAEVAAAGFTLAGTPTASLVVPSLYEYGLAYLQRVEGYTWFKTIDGDPHVLDEVILDGSTYKAVLKYTYDPPGGDPITYSTEYITLPDIGSFEFQVHYKVDGQILSGSTVFRYLFLYPFDFDGRAEYSAYGYGEYPELIKSPIGVEGTEDLTRHVPIAVIKKDGVYAEEGSPFYSSVKSLMRRINYGVDDIVEAVKENPNHGNITDVFVLWGISPFTTSEGGINYLYLYFSTFYEAIATGSYERYLSVETEELDTTIHTIILEEESYSAYLTFHYIRKESIAGTVGEIGTINKSIVPKSDVTVTVGEVSKNYNLSELIFTVQTSPGNYQKLTVCGLRIINLVGADQDKGTIHSLAGADTGMVIPLSYTVLKLFTVYNIEKILYESLHFVSFSATSTDLDWNETPEFVNHIQSVIQVAAIIISMYSLGQASGAVEIIKGLLISAVIGFAAKEIILANPNMSDFQKLVLMVAYVYASTYATNAKFGKLNWGTQLMAFVSAAGQIYTTYTGIESDRIQDELQKEKEWYESEDERLQAIIDGTKQSKNIDVNYLKSKRYVGYETTNDFFDRTINTDYIKIIRNSASSYADGYVDSKLRLG